MRKVNKKLFYLTQEIGYIFLCLIMGAMTVIFCLLLGVFVFAMAWAFIYGLFSLGWWMVPVIIGLFVVSPILIIIGDGILD
jgi:hypothetical protein